MLRLQELNRIMKKKEEENLLYIANNNKRIERLNRELDKVQNELDKSRIENEKLILQAANIKARNALESKDISVMKIRNSQIFAKMREHLLKGFSARDEDFNEIELLVNSVFPTFTNNLTKLINMSVQDYRVCLLLKCGFKPLEISMLTTHSPQSVSTTRSRLYKKCFGKKGSPSEWDSFITQFE
jgi:seryl-tRNA synthetase